jgi:hypothetical protein
MLSILAVGGASLMTLFQFVELLQRYGVKMPLGVNSWLLALVSTLGYLYLGWYYAAWGQVLLCGFSTIIIGAIIYKDAHAI